MHSNIPAPDHLPTSSNQPPPSSLPQRSSSSCWGRICENLTLGLAFVRWPIALLVGGIIQWQTGYWPFSIGGGGGTILVTDCCLCRGIRKLQTKKTEEDDIDEGNRVVDRLDRVATVISGDAVQLDEVVVDMNDANKKQTESKEALQKQIEEEKKIARELRKELDDTKSLLETQKTERTILEGTIAQLTKNTNAAQDEAKTFTADVAALSSFQEQEKKDKEKREKEISELHLQNQQLSLNIIGLNNRIDHLQTQLNEKEAILKERGKQLTRIERILSDPKFAPLLEEAQKTYGSVS